MSTNPYDAQPSGPTPPPPPGDAASAPYGTTPPPAGYGPTPPGAYPPAGGSYPTGGYGAPGYAPVAQPLAPSEERTWSTLAHAGGIVLGFVAPLVVWLVYRERSRFVEDQAKEALNFQIAVAIGYAVSSALIAIGIGLLLLPAVWVLSLVFAILAAMASNRGEAYRYPVTLRLIK